MAHPRCLVQALRRRTVVSLLAAGLLPLAAGCASEALARPSSVDLAIVDRDSGQILTVHHKDGRGHVAGTPGARYALRLSNHSSVRQLVVLSVDGVNVISGETAGWNQTGYVLDPWQSFDVAGWRKSNKMIAAFEFAALSDSYAARTDRPDNVGVIGMAVFREKPQAARWQPPAARIESEPERSAKAAPQRRGELGNAEAAADSSASTMAPRERLGTAHGEREWSVVGQTRFERMTSTPQSVVEIAYDSYRNLVAAGIIRPVVAQTHPRPFPRSDGDRRFVADPPSR